MRRTDVVGCFPGGEAAPTVVFGVWEEERLKWQGMTIRAEDVARTEERVRALEIQPVWQRDYTWLPMVI